MAFQKGRSGNPGGRPKNDKSIKDLARANSTKALKVLSEIMQDATNPATDRLSAANSILNRAWGNPAPEAHQQ